MKNVVLMVVLVPLFVLSGCVRMTVQPSTMKDFDPVPADQVVVYERIEDVPEGYIQIAVIHVQDALVHDSRERVLGKVKKKAGALGANGIVTGAVHAPSVPAEFSEDPETYHELPQPVLGANPDTQDAWMDVIAVYVKTSN